MSLKTKLLLAFLGLFAILVAVGALSVRMVTESSTSIERISRENYDTVAACYRMKEAISWLDRIALLSLHEEFPGLRDESEKAMAEFDKNLRFQTGNITVLGEREATTHLAELWCTYRRDYQEFLGTEAADHRAAGYRATLMPQSQAVREAAQQIIELNLGNLLLEDERARQHALQTRQTMLLLVLSGLAIAVLFIVVILPAILRSLARLTQSVCAIREGNLDLVVKAHSRDEIGQLAGAVNDMTVSLREFRRRARSRLLRTQRTTQLVLESLSDAVAICDPGGEIELANNTARTFFGLNPEATLADAGNASLNELFARVCRELRPLKPASYGEAIQVFRDGEERFFLPEAIPILNEERELIGVTLVLSDVTEVRQLCEMKGGLVATVSHELKTPLTSVRLAIHALLSEKVGPLTAKQVELLAAARSDTDRLHRIILNLLEMSRMEAGRMRLERQRVAPDQLVLQAADEFQAAFLDHGVHFKVDIPPELPTVLVDPIRIQAVFANLFQNALRHTPRGGEISVSAELEGKQVRFLVEDTGSGIPEAYLPLIFEKFFRGPGQDQENDTGLGLAIVKEIITLHGGRVAAENREERGTRFSFTLEAALPGEHGTRLETRAGTS